MINRICVVTNVYPNKVFIERGAFIAALINEWLKQGIKIDVIAPIHYPLWIRILKSNNDFTPQPVDNIVEPKFFALSKYFLKYSEKSFVNKVIKAHKTLVKPDVYYGQFLSYSGNAISKLSKKNSIPSFVDIGESKLLEIMDKQQKENAKNIVKNLTGAIVVSKRLENEMLELGMNKRNILLAQNGIDKSKFKQLNRIECRNKLKLPLDKFIISFVGYFNERKGALRVLKAVEKLNNSKIRILFIGSGQLPKSKFILKANSVLNENLPLWLNASDIFVLPTLAEGNCNAINEAIACGLPIITSNIDDVKFQVKENAILINPMNIDEISNAINTLFMDENLRKNMSSISLELAKNLDISHRAKIILDFMKKTITNTKGNN